MSQLYIRCFLFTITLCYSALGQGHVGDMERRVAKAHLKVSQELKDTSHHLNIHSFQLLPNFKGCNEHFKCWTGEIKEEMLHSKQLFLGGAHRLLDVIVVAEQRSVLVYAGCKGIMNITSPSFLHNTDYEMFPISRSVIKSCGVDLQVTAKKILKGRMFSGHHKKPLNVKLIADLVPGNHSKADETFISRFHEMLKHKDMSPDTTTSYTTLLRDKLSSSELIKQLKIKSKSEKVRHRQRRSTSADGQSCALVRNTLHTDALQKWLVHEAGHKGLLNTADTLPFYHCAGGCSSAKTFPNLQPEYDAYVPLRQQRPHDQFWLTNVKLRSLSIIDTLPPASCVGYQYEVFNILFYTSSDVVQQEYFYYPTQCACV